MHKLAIIAVLVGGFATPAAQARPLGADNGRARLLTQHQGSRSPVAKGAAAASRANAILRARQARGLSSAPAPAPGQSGESAVDNGGFAPHVQPTDNG